MTGGGVVKIQGWEEKKVKRRGANIRGMFLLPTAP